MFHHRAHVFWCKRNAFDGVELFSAQDSRDLLQDGFQFGLHTLYSNYLYVDILKQDGRNITFREAGRYGDHSFVVRYDLGLRLVTKKKAKGAAMDEAMVSK